MRNADIDPNISLGLNILESCAQLDAALDHPILSKDVTDRDVDELLACSFLMADAMRNAGVRGTYHIVAPLHYELLQDKRPAYWDSVRVLHLLKRYAKAHAKNGAWPFPKALSVDSKAHLKLVDIYPKVIEKYGPALSYAPNIDSYWLGDHSIDVFDALYDVLHDVYYDASSDADVMGAPRYASEYKRWIKNTALGRNRPDLIAFLYLAMFFTPYMTFVIDQGIRSGRGDPSWLLKACFVDHDSLHVNRKTLLIYGPYSIKTVIQRL